MKFESGRTDQYLYFKAVDETDLKTPETGLTGFTVYRSRNGGSATAFTTPTVSEISAANMPGIYALLLDEDMTITTGGLTEDMVVHITKTGMAPVSIKFQLFRELGVSGLKTAQGAGAGSLTLQAGSLTANNQKQGVGLLIEGSPSAAAAVGQTRVIVTSDSSTQQTTLDRSFDTTPAGSPILYRELAGSLGTTLQEVQQQLDDDFAGVNTKLDTIDDFLDSEVAAIKAKTDNLPSDPADASVVAGLIAGVEAKVDTVDTVADAIKAKTDALPSDPADASDVAAAFSTVNASLTTLLGADVAYKKGVAVTAFAFPMYDTNGNPAPSLTVTVQVSKDGAAFATVAGSVTAISGGWYKVDLSSGEMNADEIAFKATATGAKQLDLKIRTQS